MMEDEGRSMTTTMGMVLLWVVTVAVGLGITLAGTIKLAASESWIELFNGWSYPIWFMYSVAVLEVLGGLTLLIPRFATYAAGVLALIMAGAAFTVLTNTTDMVVMPSLVNLVGLAVVGFARRGVRWRTR
jgi:uncharacterized membrane protein YphA (DoxX/SURF4 family)